jgi:hypothetical protein
VQRAMLTKRKFATMAFLFDSDYELGHIDEQ